MKARLCAFAGALLAGAVAAGVVTVILAHVLSLGSVPAGLG